MSKRQKANHHILSLLSDLAERFPDMRFHQLLFNADVLKTVCGNDGSPDVVNEYGVESEAILKRLKASEIWKVK